MGNFLLAGLGNPGIKYKITRHNTGFMLAEMVADEFECRPFLSFSYCRQGQWTVVKPETFMNKSGPAVREAMDYFNFSRDQILIACDDFNLPPGKLRLRARGSAGGHRGLQSVINALGTEKFPRLRMGIGGRETEDKVAYVLEEFKASEKKIIQEMLIDALKLVKYYSKEGLQETMNRFN